MRKRLLFAFSMLLGTMLLSMGCEEKKQPSEEKADSTKVVKEKETKTVQLKPIRPTTATLFIDASASMKGYLDSGAPEFPGVISAFANYASNTDRWFWGKGKIGKTTQSKDTVPYSKTEFDDMLSNRSIPWAQESNLITVIREMQDCNKNISILVTDGILSGSNEQINKSPNRGYNIQQREAMSNELSKTLQSKEQSALIVRYMSKFTGVYSCYNNDTVKMTNQERPFFVIVIGEWKYVKYLEDELKKEKEKEKNKNISTVYENIYMIGDKDSYDTIHFYPGDEFENHEDKLRIKKEYKEIGKIVTLRADIRVLPDYMQKESWLKSHLILLVNNEPITPKAVKYDSVKTRLEISIDAGDLLCGTEDCTIDVRLKFDSPNWIDNVSDDDDLDIRNKIDERTKTFNLIYFIKGFEVLNREYVKEQSIEISKY